MVENWTYFEIFFFLGGWWGEGERERERGTESERDRERERNRWGRVQARYKQEEGRVERENIQECCVRELLMLLLLLREVRVRERERESVCLFVSMRVSECVSVKVCVCGCVCGCGRQIMGQMTKQCEGGKTLRASGTVPQHGLYSEPDSWGKPPQTPTPRSTTAHPSPAPCRRTITSL